MMNTFTTHKLFIGIDRQELTYLNYRDFRKWLALL